MKTLKKYILENIISKISLLEADESDEMDLDALNSDQPDGKTDDDSKDDNDTEDEKAKLTRRGNIKFNIWAEPKKKVKWLNDNEKYQKIDYKYIDKDKNIDIHFLLGFQSNSWKLWIGKIGAVSYDDDFYYDLETKKFAEAIISALDKVEEFIEDVEENPDNWVQFYKS